VILLFRILAAIWTLIMSYLLLVPGNVLKKFWVFKNQDKLAHFGVFIVWAALVTMALELDHHTKNIYWKVLAGAFFFGGTVELAQIFIPHRKADLFDMIMNVSGAILGYFIAEYFKKGLFSTEKKLD